VRDTVLLGVSLCCVLLERESFLLYGAGDDEASYTKSSQQLASAEHKGSDLIQVEFVSKEAWTCSSYLQGRDAVLACQRHVQDCHVQFEQFDETPLQRGEQQPVWPPEEVHPRCKVLESVACSRFVDRIEYSQLAGQARA